MVFIEELDECDSDDSIESEAAVDSRSSSAAVPSALKALSEVLSLGGGASAQKLQESSAPDWLVLTASFGEAGVELGQFHQPWGITMLPSGALCVAERGGPRLQVIEAAAFASCGMDASLDDTCCRSISLPAGAVDDVQDIYCDGAALWVADMGNHCVHRLSLPDGATLSAISGEGEHELSYPRAIATERRERGAADAAVGPNLPEQLLFICDSGNGRIMAYDTDTFAHVRSIGKRADPHSGEFVAGDLALPLGLCAHRGEVYVCDGHKHRISVFRASSGAFVRAIGEPGTGPGQMKSPFGVLVVRGMLVVTEATRVQVMTLDGASRLALEIPGAQNLSGLCSDDEQRHLYVCDTSRGCVYRFEVHWSDEGDRFAEMLNE